MGSGELVLRSLISIRCRMLVELLHRRVPIRHPNLCRLGQTNVMNTVRKKTYNNQLCYQLINILMWGTGDCHAPYPSCGKSGGLRVVWDIYSYVHIYIYISFWRWNKAKWSPMIWSRPAWSLLLSGSFFFSLTSDARVPGDRTNTCQAWEDEGQLKVYGFCVPTKMLLGRWHT